MVTNFHLVLCAYLHFVSGKKSYLPSNLQQKVICVTHLIVGREVLLLLLRVKRCNMTNNAFCVYQNDYNNTVMGDKRYHLTDSTFFFVLKKVLFVKLHIFSFNT